MYWESQENCEPTRSAKQITILGIWMGCQRKHLHWQCAEANALHFRNELDCGGMKRRGGREGRVTYISCLTLPPGSCWGGTEKFSLLRLSVLQWSRGAQHSSKIIIFSSHSLPEDVTSPQNRALSYRCRFVYRFFSCSLIWCCVFVLTQFTDLENLLISKFF